MYKFEDFCFKGKCNVCGKEKVNVVTLASTYGAVSYSYCKECCGKRLEPYGAMVAYISGAGHFPDDINEAYQKDVRRILKELNIPEEKFIKDVDKAMQEYEDYYRSLDN